MLRAYGEAGAGVNPGAAAVAALPHSQVSFLGVDESMA